MYKKLLIFMLASAVVPLFAMDAPRTGYRVAILAWGSLVECPGAIRLQEPNGFKTHGQTGPGLRIEYARQSGLTGNMPFLSLVIAPGLGANELNTFYATYNGTNLNDAIEALRVREGDTRTAEKVKQAEERGDFKHNIGYVNLKKNTYRRRDFTSATKATTTKKGSFNDAYYNSNDMLKRIVAWAKQPEHKYDAVIWTDLEPSFTSNELTLQNLQAFLNQMGQEGLRKSYCYFRITPDEIRNGTRFGNQLMEYAAARMQNHFGENVRNLSVEQCKRIVCAGQ